MYPLFILAGGLGTRLGEETQNIPKCMIDINGHPFIYYQLKRLKESGLKRVTLCLGYFSEQVLTYLETNPIKGLTLNFILDGKENLGTGGAIKNATVELSEPFFVTYGDSFLNINYRELINTYDKDQGGPLMVIYKNQNNYDSSNVLLRDGKIEYSKSNPNKDSQYIDYGLSIFQPNHFFVKKDIFDLSEVQEHYSNLNLLQHYEADTRFYEMGSIEGLEEIRTILNEN